MKMTVSVGLLGLALWMTTTPALADTVRLKTGEILVGDVDLDAAGDIVIKTRFPKEGLFTFKRDDLAPRSLYEVLDRRSDPKDAGARLRLGALAESAGLFGLAVSDYLAAAELEPELKADVGKRVARVREAIANGLLEDAKGLLQEGNPRAALMYLHTLEEHYGKTQAAKAGKKLMRTSHEHAGQSADVALKTVTEAKAPKVIRAIEKHLKKGDGEARKLKGHEGDSSRDAKTADAAIKHFEAAWKKIKTLPVSVHDAELKAIIQRLRESGKKRLTDAYLTAGSVHLQRYSLPRAETYCNLACELQPEDKASHQLHRLIIEAKINGVNGWIGR